MAADKKTRVYRKATSEERARHAEIRERISQELPDIKARARNRLADLKKAGLPIRQVVRSLKAERLRLGLSLADMYDRTGIDRAALSRLENNEEANPTLSTLERYAGAVGKQMIVLLADDDSTSR